jgi:hypothetical protein
VRSSAGRALAILVTLGLLTAGLVAVSPASASHVTATATVEVMRGEVLVAAYNIFDPDEDSDEAAFQTNIGIPKRDYNRFVRWCGSTSLLVVVAAGASVGSDTCLGPSEWYIRVSVTILDAAGGTPATHGTPVAVTVHILPG